MGNKGRGIILGTLVLVVLTGITIDRYSQARSRYRSQLKREIRTQPRSGSRSEALESLSELFLDPDDGTELVLRLGGIRIPNLPSSAPVESDDPDPIPPPAPEVDSGFRDPRDARGEGPPSAALLEYQVQPGDTLGHIAQKTLGSASRWKLIQQANEIKDPKKIEPGQVLKIPNVR